MCATRAHLRSTKEFCTFIELVADMLSREHKAELLGWVSQRLQWLKVVLVANRSDNHDNILISELKWQLGPSVFIETYHCRLSLGRIEEFASSLKHKSPKSDTFIRRWHAAARAIFSDEALSLRSVNQLLTIYEKRDAMSHIDFTNMLASALFAKMPFLGKYCCSKFVQYFLELWQHKDRELTTIPEPEPSPMWLLVRTALSDLKGDLCSFPDFVANMKRSHAAHPILRLAAWVMQIWTAHAQPKDKIIPLLDCLTKLQVADQVLFPRVLGEASDVVNLRSGEVYSKSGDFADLQWLTDVISHGNPVSWSSVKKVWDKHFISSSEEFSNLLSVCPNPGACLSVVDPQNLCALIEGEDGTTIAETCIAAHVPKDEDKKPHSVFYSAAWSLFRNAPEKLPKNFDLLSTLLWASQFAFSLLKVKSSPKDHTRRLRETLTQLTNELMFRDPLEESKIVTLWEHIFARLLVVDQPNGVSNEAAMLLARKVNPPPSEWPELVKVLHYVGNKTITSWQLEKLFDSSYFQKYKGRLVEEVTVPDAKFAESLLQLPKGTLSTRWQRAILRDYTQYRERRIFIKPQGRDQNVRE